MHPLETYLTDLRTLQDAGTDETAGYPAFKALVDSVGDTLKPKVLCLIHPAGVGAGIPDAGFFTADQVDKKTKAIKPGQLPTAGIAEIKGPGASLDKIQVSDQVTKYLERYGQVLVTNYREFRLVVRTANNELRLAERLTLAESAAAFRELTKHPKKGAETHGKRVEEFLTRCLRNSATLTDPKDVAWFLASHARDALDQLEHDDPTALNALASVRKSFEQALGLTFTGDEGDHFFRSSLVQTLFYGIFSAWVLWARDPKRKAKDHFDWKTAAWTLRVPMISALFQQIATPNQLGLLHLTPVLENTGDLLNRVDRAAFFQKFQEAEAVQYFYEPFLEEFDPGLRKELGVWYTPREVVKYMVARVDTVLREELGITRGLADEQVVVLDPCCGTGAFLLEVLERIGKTLKEEGGDALTSSDLRKAVTERLYGFELLPAPFVVSHLQLGLRLQQLGAPFKENDRAGVYLTNALTGWLKDETAHLPFPELEQERELAEEVKQQKKVLVILGNPPYNGYAGTTESEEERGLTEAYKKVKKVAKPQGQGLNDLYVRFYRMAERKIVEGTGRGVICFVSNYSWLDGLSYTGMRERFIDKFHGIWIDNLHGDRKISEYAPDGRSSQTIFAQSGTTTGIKVGIAVATLCYGGNAQSGLLYRDFDEADSEARKQALLTSLSGNTNPYTNLIPDLALNLAFKPGGVTAGYFEWPTIPDLMPVSFPGVKTSRDDFLVDIDKRALESRLDQYFDPEIDNRRLSELFPSIMTTSARFPAQAIRKALVAKGRQWGQVRRYLYRPFDLRWVYWEPSTKLLDEKREDYAALIDEQSPWLFTTGRTRKNDAEPCFTTTLLTDLNAQDSGARGTPLRESHGSADAHLFSGDGYNLSTGARTYIRSLALSAEDLFYHCVAIIHSERYRSTNTQGLRSHWPRLPLPRRQTTLTASAQLGRMIHALMDPREQVAPKGHLALLGRIRATQGTEIDPASGHLALEAGWGHFGPGSSVVPAKGRVEESGPTVKIFLNEHAYWDEVPATVWKYSIGGYPVIKKWLSYREKKILGRDLTVEEARYVTEMIQRIAAILALGPELDKNYEACKKETYPWKDT